MIEFFNYLSRNVGITLMIFMTVGMIASFNAASVHFWAMVGNSLLFLCSSVPWIVGSTFFVCWFVTSAYNFVFVDGSCATDFRL